MNIFLFDLETTGVDTTKDRIVQIAWMILDHDLKPVGKPVSMLVYPEMKIPAGATEVHGITDEMVKGVLSFSGIANDLATILKHCHIAGFNSNSFDVPMLVAEFARCGIDVPFNHQTLFIDVLAIYRKQFSNKLTDIYKRLFGKEMANAHDALGDITATKEVMQWLVDNANDEIGYLPEQWAEYSGGMDDPYWFKLQNGVWCFAKGKNEGVSVLKEKSYCDWMMGSPTFGLGTKATLCKIWGADLWKSIAANRFVFYPEPDGDLPF